MLPSELIPLFRGAWGDSLSALVQPSSLAREPSAQVDSSPGASLEAPAAELPASFAGAAAHAGTLVAELERWLWSRHQFVQLSLAERAELGQSITRALLGLEQTGDVASTLVVHRAELAAFVRARFGATPREVVCAEYSPELQLAVLGLAGARLAEPILDVGCGEQALLVGWLRARGLDATGLDRALRSELGRAPGTDGDWLKFDYGRERYGSVLSHLGFTLHFLHHHLAQRDAAYDYARAYMAILGSLKPGGRFVYTPGLPFLEPLLERSMYRVHHVPFTDELRVASLRQIEASTGLSLSHATHVERLR